MVTSRYLYNLCGLCVLCPCVVLPFVCVYYERVCFIRPSLCILSKCKFIRFIRPSLCTLNVCVSSVILYVLCPCVLHLSHLFVCLSMWITSAHLFVYLSMWVASDCMFVHVSFIWPFAVLVSLSFFLSLFVFCQLVYLFMLYPFVFTTNKWHSLYHMVYNHACVYMRNKCEF